MPYKMIIFEYGINVSFCQWLDIIVFFFKFNIVKQSMSNDLIISLIEKMNDFSYKIYPLIFFLIFFFIMIFSWGIINWVMEKNVVSAMSKINIPIDVKFWIEINFLILKFNWINLSHSSLPLNKKCCHKFNKLHSNMQILYMTPKKAHSSCVHKLFFFEYFLSGT